MKNDEPSLMEIINSMEKYLREAGHLDPTELQTLVLLAKQRTAQIFIIADDHSLHAANRLRDVRNLIEVGQAKKCLSPTDAK